MNDYNLNIVFKALSEITRLRIMVLITGGELCVCDLTEVLSLPQSTVSRHMSRLKNAGLVKDRRAGKWIYYRLDDSPAPSVTLLYHILKDLSQQTPYINDIENLKKHKASKTCD